MSEALQFILVLCMATGFCICASVAIGKTFAEIIIRQLRGKV